MNKLKSIIAILLLGLIVISFKAKAQTWDSVGTGMNGPVMALAVDTANDILYAGGTFTTAGGVSANYIAKWDGISWSAVGTGMDDVVYALAFYNDTLYAGGAFTTAGGVSAYHIARWDGTNWSSMGSGVNGNAASCIAEYNGELYAGGDFTTAGAIIVNSIAKWNGVIWDSVGSGVTDILAPFIATLAVHAGNLYIGGAFDTVGGIGTHNIAKWNGTIWDSLQNGLGDMGQYTYDLATYNNDLYAVGSWTYAGIDNFPNGIEVNFIAKWDGVNWDSVGSGFNASCYRLTTYNGELYAGGWFTTAGGVSANAIARWDGTIWDSVGSGIIGGIYELTVYQNELYVGGDFNTAGGINANYIAKWGPNTSPPCNVISSFTPSATLICEGETINFTNTSTGAITYEWQENGTPFSTAADTSRTFSTAGTYTISLIADSASCSSDSSGVIITVNPTYDTTVAAAICQGDSIQLPGGAYADTSGIYYDTLTSVNGCDSIIETILTVNPLPVITVTPSPGVVCNYGDTVMLIASGAVSYTWSPAIGLNITTGDTVLAFPLTDTTYTVTGINASGCVDSTTVSVQLNTAAPVANFTANPTSVCEGNTVTFNNTSIDEIGFSWSFSGGITADTTVQNPVVTYNTAGVFDVTLTALGCSIDSTITLTGYITVNPTYSITDPPIDVCAGGCTIIYGICQDTTGIYYDSLTTVNGCDSVHSTVFTVNQSYYINIPNDTICDGDSIMIFGIYRSIAGLYSINLTSVSGCDSTITTTLIVNSLPTVNLGADTTICNGCSITLDAGGGFANYDWSTGENTQTINVNLTDTYIVTVTDANDCIGGDTIVVDVVSGLNELSSVESISIYPNPNTGEFVIEMNVLKIQDVEIKLLNIMGQVIYSENLKRFKGVYFKRIDIKGLSTGVYQLQIKTGYGEVNKKVVVE